MGSMLPTLRQLQYLKLLSEHGSFSRAAESAHVTQPTLSAGIQELEKILGAAVVDRARSGVILTAAGQEAVRRAQDILTRTEDLVQAARGAGQPLAGRFRLGVIPTVAPYLLPRALPLLRDRFPKLRLFLREDLTQRLIASLKAGALDAALIALPYDMSGLDWAHVEDDELLAAAPANHPMTAVVPRRSRQPQRRRPDPAGRRPLPARPRPGRLRPGAAQGRRRRGELRGHLPADPGADDRLGPGRLVPAGHGGAGRPDRQRRRHGAAADHGQFQPRDRGRLARGLDAGRPRGGCWRRRCRRSSASACLPAPPPRPARRRAGRRRTLPASN
jgi:DNA-binding transcriptional LysR family regulator